MKKRLLAIVLAMTVVFAYSAVGAFAANDVPTGDLDNAVLVKYLKKGSGVNDPNATFTFKFAKAVEADGATAKAADYPDAPADVTVKASEMVDAKIANTGDTKKAVKLADIFNGTFKSAGVYAFTVKEVQSGLTEDTDNKTTETMDYDKQQFTVYVYVVNDGNGTKIDQFTVENEAGEKVNPTDDDPTPGEGEDRNDPNYKADGFTFTNAYTVKATNDEDPINPDDPQDPSDDGNYAGFGVSKAVDGEYASKTEEFTFQVKITKPLGSTAEKGKYVAGGEEKEFTYGTAFTVKLKHGERFGVTEMELGSTVEVNEAAAEKYTPSVTGLISKNASANSVCGDSVVVGSNNKGAVAAFVNKMDENNAPTPTGIIINNLPYVLVILLAIGGIAVFARKRRYE